MLIWGTPPFLGTQLHIYKQPTEYISEKASQQAGGENSEIPPKFHVCPSINKSTEQHSCVPLLQFAALSNHCKPLQLAI